ncbi:MULTISPECIES: LysR family transcriptional regulator [Shewanella]|uniref:LysR family transcriptional regulator n=1 Tax=Shewanella marisflavi TaxID=260364 RepID=A0AAC9TYW2_9GAMM|nr:MULTISPECIES: LysR family transcriptional regulator [Shewanella]ASJ95862.1 LysR family transcriptional regulator [Shewanella marisflavi]QDF74418.1 LysR family transcriptional regulator [Shewanella marisflavi]
MARSLGTELELIHLFVHLVNAGGFSQVAKELGMPVATVSRKLTKLESLLDTQLIMRSTRKLRLTEEGAELFSRYQDVVAQFDSCSDTRIEKPEGTLRIAAPVSIISMIFIGVINDFSKAYPDIQLHITQNNSSIDLIDEGVDVAIVGGAQPDSSWVSKSLGVLDYGLFASPGYLACAGSPHHPDHLVEHSLIKVWPLFNWSMKHVSGEDFYYEGPAKLTLGDLNGAVRAAVDDGGILYGPELFVKSELATGELRRVLPDWHGEQRRISLLYHQRTHQPLKVKLFIEFMQDRASCLFH